MFSVNERERIQDRVLEMAAADPRVVAGAVVGSLARDEGDRWSDLDLTFAVENGVPVLKVLEDWTRSLAGEFRAVHLFDLPSGRVFIGCSCCPDAYSSISPSRQRRRSGRLARSSGCCSEAQWTNLILNRQQRETCWAMPSTTRYALAFVLSVAATGRPNTGSVAFVIMPSASRVVAARCQQVTAEASTLFLLACTTLSGAHW
jgi:predicted nucleotidyltransferase